MAEKLGIKPGMSLLLVNVSESLRDAIPDGVSVKAVKSLHASKSQYDYIHLFATQEAAIIEALANARPMLVQHGMIWVSWPKKAAKKIANIETDLTEDVIRGHALKIGLVDVKVCAVDEIWSGLKLVIPVKLRE